MGEIFCGVRASLDDMVLAHLVSLVRISSTDSAGEKEEVTRKVIGPLIISAVSPLLDMYEKEKRTDTSIANQSAMYKKLGWTAPDTCMRLYDSRETWQKLACEPRWNFDSLVKEFEASDNGKVIEHAYY